MKQEYKPEDIPEWDGDGNTAIEWFAGCQEFASNGDWLPGQMSKFMYLRLKEGSHVRNWFSILPENVKEYMRRYYVNFLTIIKEHYLGELWQHERNIEYQAQSFRQAKHRNESPLDFILRRLTHARILMQLPMGGRQEVLEVLRNAPIEWKTILVAETIPDTLTLQTRVRDYSAQLDHAYRQSSAHFLTRENALPYIREVISSLRDRNASEGTRRPFFRPRQAQLATNQNPTEMGDVEDKLVEAYFNSMGEPPNSFSEGTQEASPTHNATTESDEHPSVKEVYATTKRRQRPPPKGGYPFPMRNEVKSVLRPPPSPCKCCGSAHHWDKECPWYNVWERKYGKKAVNLAESNEESQYEDVYTQAYEALLIHVAHSAYLTEGLRTKGFLPHKELVEMGLAEDSQAEPLSGPWRATVEEVEDEGDGHPPNHSPHSQSLLERVTSLNVETEETAGNLGTEKQTYPVSSENLNTQESVVRIPDPLSLSDQKTVHWLKPRRKFIDGHSAVGQSVVAMRGRVSDLGESAIDLRLDSCADISLISEEYYNSLKNPPQRRTGLKLSLWQLTQKGASISGYTKLPVYLQSQEGDVFACEAEAYIVPGMTVPILLGEDFHTTYELTVSRNVAFGTSVHFGDTGKVVNAQGVRRTGDHNLVRKSAWSLHAHFVKAKTHRRNKAKRQRQRRALQQDKLLLRAAEDVRIPAHHCKQVKVRGHFEGKKEWLVERIILQVDETHNLVVPNILISSENPILPIANTSNRPLMVRKGEIVGRLLDPEEGLDKPVNERELEEMEGRASKTALLINLQKELAERSIAEEKTSPRRVFIAEQDGTIHKATRSEEDEDYGPKTAAVPEPDMVPSKELEEILDVGDLPDELKPRVWEMLRRRIGAFGFDGRLGHLDTKCRIRTKDNVEPIAVPMYGSSPAKREVIEKQLNVWFQQEVIEPSQSPWSAPVVIVYRNGKARFCIDYRRLNAVTVPDEFPIPRQGEILSALSGAQVLSSLDALAGFTQIEMDPRDVEKTAFRTHKGLFQFKRMPFGLRNGPAIFQRVMQGILAPYLWLFALVYIDDIIVYSKSYEDHITHLDQLLSTIEASGLTLSPQKCHLFYSSVLLLGHKVSRLGLSTHEEKVKAILQLRRPTKVVELQTFLGMVVYFSAFIPYYSSIAAPLFRLLRKGAKWNWGPEEDHAFQSAKQALLEAPVLGHPIEKLPYRLYTDASDEALGCTLQQIQPITVRDLKGTKAYERLKKSYDEGKPIPKLTVKLSSKIVDSPEGGQWSSNFDDSQVFVERVITYWSRTFKPAETRYSATEREALAAKEGLVKFLPIIEGEKITLVTDHAALQWAKTYENANKRLAAWGAVFSAFSPHLDIVHRPGRTHSNVDPLSRLPRAPPEHVSPRDEKKPSLELNGTEMERAERLAANSPAQKIALNVRRLDEWSEAFATKASSKKKRRSKTGNNIPEGNVGGGPQEQIETTETLDPYQTKKLWEANHRPPNVSIHLNDETLEQFKKGYEEDISFQNRLTEQSQSPNSWNAANRFFRDSRGLLFFRDADFHARVCVPKSMRANVLKEAHESPFESAHAGPEKLWASLSEHFYWPRMKKDIIQFCTSCDVCQKTKPPNFTRYGTLNPHSIPVRPYESVSLDMHQ
ncbi:hypothetical protein NLI96_g12874 [Meripilus lineatus]|uniref:Gag3-Pol3 n=1 Tax=Meripilus lineatus TaxID=2056292 RepID=A0AAD5UP39_9APHY|nr:hypothetical protein NLI96_g12874 [Physisporinus lineatus]